MRKVSVASQDGGDSTSITSGVDNEMKKSGGGILKTKKTSIKRKVQNFSLESDDGVVEPLLQKEKEKETGSQSAKFSLSRTKTDSMTEKDEEKDKLLDDNKTSVPSMTPVPGITNNLTYANGVKDSQITKSYASAAPIHNHMNTNVFASRNEVSSFTAPKTQILVDIDGNKQKAHSPSPLIFTTAKIHTDGKTKTLEPVHVTPQPILSTVEGNIVKVKTCTDEQRLKNDFGSTKKDYHLGFEALESKSDVSHPCAPNESSPNTVATVSVSFYSGILNKGPTVTSASTICTPFVPTELKTFKYIPSEGKVKDITANKMTTANTKDNTKIKQNGVNNASLSQTNHYAKPEATKTSSTVKDVKSPSSTTIKSGETNNLSQFKLQHASAPIAASEVEIDINKNIQAANVSTPRKFETSISPSIVGEITKDSCNKQLQRQKDAIVEDDKMTDKYSRSERDKPNDSRIPSVSAKSNVDTAKEVEDPSKKVTSPQICANNVVKDSSTITTAPSTINKGVVVDTKTSTFVPKPSVKTTDTNNCTTSSTLKTGVTKSSTQSTSLSTAEGIKEITSNHSKIPTSTTPVTNAKTTSSFTQPLSSLTGTSNISKTSVNGTTKTKEESKPMANVPKATSANSPTPTPNSNQTASNTPQVSSLTSNKSKTPTNVAKSTENSTFPQTVLTTTTSSSSKTSTSSAVKITPTTTPSKTVSHIPLTTSSPSALKQTTTTAATSSLLSNKPSPVNTSEVCKTSTALTPNKSSETPSLSQSTKVKPSVSTVVNSTPNSSAVKTMTPATTSVASKPSTVTTMKTSTSKLSSIPKTTTKSVNATAESTSSTIKPPANSKISINQSRNDKSKP